MRKELGHALVEYGSQNKDVVVLDADVSSSTMTKLFQQAHPERFFDVGIAEAGMVDTAVGLADGAELKALIPKVAEHVGPVYMRISRAEVPRVFSEKDRPQIGARRILEEGRDLTLAATGIALHRVLEASRILGRKGISARAVEIHTLKPFDVELVCRCAQEIGPWSRWRSTT